MQFIFSMSRFGGRLVAMVLMAMGTLACGFVGGAFSPNAVATPTVTIQAEPLTLDGATATPAVTQTSPETANTVTTPVVSGPIESLAITAPLPNQGVRGSIRVEGVSDATFEQQLGILVRDRGGKVVGSATAKINSPIGQRGPFSAEVSIPAYLPTQSGRIIVYAIAPRDGGLTHLASIEVQLNSDQPANIAALNPNRDEAIVITEPAPNATVKGLVKVSGMADPTSDQHLIVEVRGPHAETLGRATATIGVANQRGSFSVDVPFRVNADPPGRIVVYSIHPRDGLTVHLNSVEVNLQP
ncbi:MAG: Gmad2 immunoglobulin-like domain-containing protein [Anaerolineae bacterium]